MRPQEIIRYLRSLNGAADAQWHQPFSTGDESRQRRKESEGAMSPSGSETASAEPFDETLVDIGPDDMARRLAQRQAAEESEEGSTPNLMRGPASTERDHRGGGGGTRLQTITNRYCRECDCQYDRRAIKRKERTSTTWTPKCNCDAGFISRQETRETMGAKSVSSSSGRSSGGARPPKPFRRRDNFVVIAAAGGALTDVEYDVSGGSTGYFKIPPIFDWFMKLSCGRDGARVLRIRHILKFFTLTREYEIGDIGSWIVELTELEESDRERKPGEPGRRWKFGTAKGVDKKERFPRSLCDDLQMHWKVVFDEDDTTGKRLSVETLRFEGGARLTVTHVVNLAIALYIWYLISLSEKVDTLLMKRKRDPNPNRFTSLAEFRSSLDECEILCDLVRERDDPIVNKLRADAARPMHVHDLLAPFLDAEMPKAGKSEE